MAILIATGSDGIDYSTEGQGGLGVVFLAGDYMLQVNAISAGQSRIIFETESNEQVANELLTVVAALPINLIGFSAQATAKQVKLYWQTGQESQNATFHIEHRTDTQNWSDINMIPGAGNSTVLQDYTFAHQTPAAGNNHYRLHQTDFDGTFTYSEIRTVEFAYGEESLIAYPNPATDLVTVIVPDAFQSGRLQLYSTNGSLIREQMASNTTLNTSGLATGAYIIQVTAKKGILQHKLVV
ncbi:T9SS type A sorting domain-containing protein [Neolewinella aurantiaca]|uniref:T9SS type A sorting domain-containing protein n=1 Tax=Neolewinella aurantiaca TaxID=2602767 RepID=UPI00164F19A0|nr:T9SS type A sorting domain-containing protein [Neolewinella aurantiaca]